MQALKKSYFWVVLWLVLLVSSPGVAQNLRVRVSPGDTSLFIGDSYEISVMIDSVVELGAFEFKLAFSPQIVRIDTVQLGAFLGGTGRFTIPMGPAWDTLGTRRVLYFGGFSFGNAPGASGSGTLAKIKMTAIALGTTQLELSEVLITNTEGKNLAIDVLSNGRLSVVGGDTDPIATQFFAEPDTIAADAVCWSLVTVIPRDGTGNPLPVIQSVQFTTTAGNLHGTVQSHPDGRYTQRLYAPITPGEAKITGLINGVIFPKQISVVFSAMPQRRLRLSPPQQTVPWSDFFDLTVIADSVCDLGGFEFSLAFPHKIVELDSVWLGNFLGSSGRTVIPASPRFSPQGGATTLYFGAVSFGASRGPDGSGALAHLRFKAVGVDTADLNFTDALLTTTEANTLKLASYHGARAIVTANAVDSLVSLIEAEPDSIPADGVFLSLITVTPRDNLGNKLPPGLHVELANTAGAWIEPVVDRGDGTYTQRLISEKHPGAAVISAKVNGIAMNQTARVVFFPPPGKIVRIAPADTTVFLGGSILLAIRGDTMWDLGSFEFSLRYPNQIVRLDSLWLSDFLGSTGRTVRSIGPARQDVKDTSHVRFGAFSIGTGHGPSGNNVLVWLKLTPLRLDTAQIDFDFATLTDVDGNSQILAALQDSRIIIASSGVDPATTLVTARPSAIPANGVSTSLITVTPKDALGNTLPPGQFVEIRATAPEKWTGEVTSQSDGSYTRRLQSPASPGQAEVTATVNGVVADQKPVVRFTRRPQTSIYVAPADTTVLIRKSFTLAVNIDSVWDLGGFELSLSFKTAIVKFDTAWIGAFPGSSGRAALLSLTRTNPVGDSTVVNIFGFSVNDRPGPDGSGVLAHLQFTALVAGTTRLGLLKGQLTNPSGQVLPLDVLKSGRVSVITGVVDSERSIVAADPDTLPADGMSLSTITIIPKDISGQDLGPGLTVNLQTTPPGILLDTVAKYQGDYKYIGTLKATRASGLSLVTALVEGVRLQQQGKVLFQPTPKIFPHVDSLAQKAGDIFNLTVRITGAQNDRKKIARLKWTLNFAPVKELFCLRGSIQAGEFLGLPHEIDFKVDTTKCSQGKLIFETNRRYRGAAILDSGNVAVMQFKSNAYASDSTIINFAITDLTTLDSLGKTILLPADNSLVTLRGPTVWPGDTDNNGVVNQTDVLPIGTYYGKAGTKRRHASTQWIGQYATRWQPKEATCADANGDGKVDVIDTNAVTINWGRTHGSPVFEQNYEPMLRQELSQQGVLLPVIQPSPDRPGILLEIVADSLDEFSGVAFELEYPAYLLQVTAVEKSSVWSPGALLIFKADRAANKLGIGICESAMVSHTPDRSSIVIARIIFRSSLECDAATLNFKVSEALAVDARANRFRLAGGFWGNSATAEQLPEAFLLRQNYPNPFNPGTRIEFALPHAARVVIRIHDVLGREIDTLIDEQLPAGSHFVLWDGKDRYGNEAPSGIYFVQIQAAGLVKTMKAVKVR